MIAIATTVSTLNANALLGETTEEMFLRLQSSKMDACVMLADMGIQMVEKRQTHPDFQLIFDDLNASRAVDPDSVVTMTILYLTKVVAGHPLLTYPENVERWKSEVYLSGFEFCRGVSDF